MKTKAQRQAIDDRLQELHDRDGRLTPDAVVADARRKGSVLHGEFEWDDKKAAAAHRIEQARTLISSVVIVIRNKNVDVRAVGYVRDPRCASHEQGYASVRLLSADTEAARTALISEFTKVGDLLRRARNLALALEMAEDVDRIIGGVAELRTRAAGIQPGLQ